MRHKPINKRKDNPFRLFVMPKRDKPKKEYWHEAKVHKEEEIKKSFEESKRQGMDSV